MATLTEYSTQTFAVTAIPTIRINSFAGDLRVVPGEGTSVTIEITKKVSAPTEDAAKHVLERLSAEITQAGDYITIKTRERQHRSFFNISQNRQIDIVVTTPAATHLDFTVNSGDSDISGINGMLTAHMNSGDLHIQDMRIGETAIFELNSGDLEMQHITIAAPVTFEMNSGNMTLHDVTFQDRVTMDTNSGDIRGDIVLAASVRMHVETNSGNVHLALPATTAAHLEAVVNSGDITIDGFPVSARSRFSQASASGDLNPAPTSSIAVELNSGDLVIAAR